MKTVCIECKQIDEWDKDTQDKIIEKYRYINTEGHDWYDGEYEWWAGKLAEQGYDIEETRYKDGYKWSDGPGSKRVKTGKQVAYTGYNISFSGFYSQGDGASFTGTIDIIKWLEYNKIAKYDRILKLMKSGNIDTGANIKRDRWGNYVHWNTTSISYSWYLDDKYTRINELLESLEEDILKDHQQLNKDIYDDLEKCYDNQVSDEAVKETLIANEYEFDEDGRMM